MSVKIFQPHQFELTTGLLESIYCKNLDSSFKEIDTGFVTLKVYNSGGEEMTDQGKADSDGVATVVDWQPKHDYIMMGGEIYQAKPPEFDIRLWRVLDPGRADLQLSVGGLNLRLLGEGGSVKSTIPDPNVAAYADGQGPNKMRFIFKHDVGVKHTVLVNLFTVKVVVP